MLIDICPTVDFAFKLMLGNPAQPEITIHFLNSVLTGGPRIRKVTILNPFLEKETADDKLSVLDIKAQDEQGRYYNIEMQTSLANGLPRRLAYYAGRLYVDQMLEGMAYGELSSAISICVLSKLIFPKINKLHLDFRLRECDGQVLVEELQIHLLQLPKSRATVHNIDRLTPVERWAFLLLNAHQIDAEELRRLMPEPAFHAALGVLEMISNDSASRERYEARLKAQRDEEARLAYALERGEQIGQQRGEQIGQQRGEQIGQQRGEQIGRIRLLEELVGRAPTDSAELAKLSADQLAEKLADLHQSLRDLRS